MQENSAEENSKESELTPEVPTSEETAKNANFAYMQGAEVVETLQMKGTKMAVLEVVSAR